MVESCSWLFVENVPLLHDKKNVARQLKVEMWLGLAQLLRELKGEDAVRKSSQQVTSYVV
jgi:hypothetical protein